MRRGTQWALFGAVVIVQLAVPTGMVVDRVITLRHGEVFRFRCAPVDPYDAFRGRYVSIDLEPDNGPVPAGVALESGRTAYAYLETDPDGFARFAQVLPAPSATGPYLRVKVEYVDPRDRRAYFRIPVDRYYMREDLAPKAEQAYQEISRRRADEATAAYVTVRVRSGSIVLEELYINGLPIHQYLQSISQDAS